MGIVDQIKERVLLLSILGVGITIANAVILSALMGKGLEISLSRALGLVGLFITLSGLLVLHRLPHWVASPELQKKLSVWIIASIPAGIVTAITTALLFGEELTMPPDWVIIVGAAILFAVVLVSLDYRERRA